MRNFIAAALLCAASIFAQDATLVGQKPVNEARVAWGSNYSTTLYVAGATGYMIDVAGVRTVLDTAINSVGGDGACTADLTIRTGTAVQPQSRGELSYGVRATDIAQAGFQIYFAVRYKNTPSTADTNWVLPQNNFIYDSSRVYLTHTNPGATASRTTRFVNFWASGQQIRVCVKRTSIGPGAGDTLVFSNNWLRFW